MHTPSQSPGLPHSTRAPEISRRRCRKIAELVDPPHGPGGPTHLLANRQPLVPPPVRPRKPSHQHSEDATGQTPRRRSGHGQPSAVKSPPVKPKASPGGRCGKLRPMTRRQAAPTDAELAGLANELRDAVTTFEGALPQRLGTVGDWPELTPARRESLREVRRLATLVKQPLWPRSSCLSCGGHGMYLIDAEIDPDFRPCRRCLTTGMRLATLLGP